jgi:hypothetical protein
VTAVEPRAEPITAASPGLAVSARIERVADALLDAGVVAFTVWVAIFHLARAFDLSVDVAFGAWVVVAVAAIVLLGRLRPGDRGDGRAPVRVATRPLIVLGVAASVLAVAAARQALDVPGWWLYWGGAVAVLATGLALVVRARIDRDEPAPPRPGVAAATAGTAAVILVALLFGVLAAIVVRPDSDDVLLVNRSVWIEDRGGSFPERDVLFSDEVFALTRSREVEPAIEPLVGASARWLPWSATTLSYLALGPIVAGLSVLALWRLLRALHAPAPAVATLVGALFLAFDGAFHTTFGNFSFGRAWQGKTAFLVVAVPLLWTFALRFARDDDRRALALLGATNVVGVGLSATAVLVAPIVTVLGVGAGCWGSTAEGRGRRFLAGAALGALPVAIGAVGVLGGEQPLSPAATQLLAAGSSLVAQSGRIAPLDGTSGLGAADAWYTVIGTGAAAAVAASAMLLSWVGVRDRAARLALLAAPLTVIGVFGAPGVLRLVGELADARSIVWRVVWVAPVPAMVGLLATVGLVVLEGTARSVAAVAGPALIAVALVVGGTPVWSDENGARISSPAWDVDAASLAAADRVIELARPGSVVAVPEAIGEAVAVQTVDVRAHNPRSQYLRGRWVVPQFRAHARGVLTRAVEVGDVATAFAPDVSRALDVLDVSAACVRPSFAGSAAEIALTDQGFALVDEDEQCRYWQRAREPVPARATSRGIGWPFPRLVS